MAFKPILFNTDMVQAILDDRKTVTRRLIKAKGKRYENESVDDWCVRWGHKSPYSVGDYLYVRESFMQTSHKRRIYKADYSLKELEFFKESGMKWTPSIHMPSTASRIYLEVTDVYAQELQDITEEQALKEGVFKNSNGNYSYQREWDIHGHDKEWTESARDCFLWGCWNSTLDKKSYKFHNWQTNPYVWVVEFRRLKDNEIIFY